MINTMTAYSSLYEYLELDASATEQEINKAFRSLAKQHHPDRQSGDPQLFVLINKAYDILRSQQYRSLYDTQGIYGLIEAYPRVARPPLNGAPSEVTYTIDLQQLVSGGRIKLKQYNSKLKRDHSEHAPIDFPPGMEEGHQLTIDGAGLPGTDGGEDGPLNIVIKHKLPPSISLDAWKLILSIQVPQALLDTGGSIRAQLLEQAFEISIPAQSQAMDRFPIPIGQHLPPPFTGAQVELVTQEKLKDGSGTWGPAGLETAESRSGTLPTPVERKSKINPLALIITILVLIPGLAGVVILSLFLYQLLQNQDQPTTQADQNQAQVIPGDANTEVQGNSSHSPEHDQASDPKTPVPDPSPHLVEGLTKDEQARIKLQETARRDYDVELDPQAYDNAQQMQDMIDRLELNREIRAQFGIDLKVDDFDDLESMSLVADKVMLTHVIRNEFGMDLRYQDFNSPEELQDLRERLQLEKVIKDRYDHPVTHKDFFSAESMKDAMQRMAYQKLLDEKHGVKLRYTDYPSAELMKKAIIEMGHQINE